MPKTVREGLWSWKSPNNHILSKKKNKMCKVIPKQDNGSVFQLHGMYMSSYHNILYSWLSIVSQTYLPWLHTSLTHKPLVSLAAFNPGCYINMGSWRKKKEREATQIRSSRIEIRSSHGEQWGASTEVLNQEMWHRSHGTPSLFRIRTTELQRWRI